MMNRGTKFGVQQIYPLTFSIPYRISYISFSKLLSATRSRNRGITRTRIEEENSNSIFIKLTLLNEFLYKGM